MNNYIVDKEAYDMLVRCSRQEDFTKWNNMRKKQGNKRIYLEGVDLQNINLVGADLSFMQFSHAKFDNSKLNGTNFQRSWLNNARLNNTDLSRTDFKDAILNGAQLKDANMIESDLRGVCATYAVLNGCNMHNTHLEGADFSYSVVDGETLIATTHIDGRTLFTSVGLPSARLKSGLIGTLYYNIRKNRWEEWYNTGSRISRTLKKLFIKPYWKISDYGRSSMRILIFFGIIVCMFAIIYWNHPEIIENMQCDTYLTKIYRTISFSLVTMITLGFGSMNAAPSSFLGHFTVAFQIIFGYVILAALVSRLAIMFDSDGPDVPLKKKYKKFSGI